MINFYDIDSVESFASARRERFLMEVESDRIKRLLQSEHPRTPGRFRRATGTQLIRAGAWLSGEQPAVVRRSSATT